MKTTRRRYWVYLLLFLFNMIAYTDRVNISVAGKPIADELGLSPVALGYLFSSFLWAYVLMMLPGGRLIDRFGPHNVAAVATAVWSVAQMLTGATVNFFTMLLTRLGLGIGEAPFAPVTYRSVGLWGPLRERGTAIAAISAGSSLGAAIGRAVCRVADFGQLVALVVRRDRRDRAGLGRGVAAAWCRRRSRPGGSPNPSGSSILAERDGGLKPPEHGGVGYLGLIRAPAMWGLFISQGCMVYTVYLYLSWLPNYLQTQRHMSVMGSGIYTALPFLIASAVNIIANWIGDRALSVDAVHAGKRRYLVAICLLLTASGLLIPYVESLTAIIILVTCAVSFANCGPATNGALTNDLLRSPADAGRALAFLVLGGNSFGLCAPIVTGYLVESTGNFNTAFIAAGVLALVGAIAALTLSRGALGEVSSAPKPAMAG